MQLGPLRSTGRLPDGPLEDKKAEDGSGGLHAVQTAKKTRTLAEWAALGRSPTPTFRLLDLPEDIIDLILQFVALVRLTTQLCSIIAEVLNPIPSQIQIFNRFRRLHYLRFIQTALETVKDVTIPPNARFVELSTQVMTYSEIGGSGASASRSRNWSFPMGFSLLITSNLTELRLRHLQFDMWLLPVRTMAQFLLEQCKALTELKLTLWNVKRPIAQWVRMWDRLEVFEIECRPLQKSPSATIFTQLPLETALQSLIVRLLGRFIIGSTVRSSPLKSQLTGRCVDLLQIPSDAALRSLSVTIFRSSQSRPSRTVGERLCAALECFSPAGPKIRHLSLDEFTLLKPQDVEWPAEKFPNVRELHLGDRIVWAGGRVSPSQRLR
ncbi:BZ3500_MvSof-1268-A1-R1_Chr1-3g02251 [Microbotryum saponariae]|uniref:BZ3500_MvSof-1268-A1-R1_Chr1-3g02251 protein n=1 Tax=Microbotryum saponariae TaxID=289078 RepID=A0A2X0KPM4_9BASI|nr:BZ3500_MvSof-1268-A1-R1_Chr1-3g02251 [Microbotryum saponariae]SCZ95782.1 BZ3501_MvSof-1269-A2-R1_Chr1-3g01854 [Microbotryum saponariae]